MKKLIISLFILSSVFAKPIDCKLSNDNKRIEVKEQETPCEFPEGNKVKCAQVISYVKSENPKIGPIIFREEINFNDFCLTKNIKKIPDTTIKGRVISSSGHEDLYAMMKCPSQKKTAELFLFIGKKTKRCILNLD